MWHWRSLFAGRGDAAISPAAVASRATAYQPSAWFDTGWRLLAANNQAEIETLLAATDAAPHDQAERECLCAGLTLMRGEPRAARAHAEAALAVRADFSHAYVQSARALRALGQHPAALAGFQRATGLTPDDAQAWAEQAVEHLALGEREEALDCFELALAHAPDCAAARLGLSRVLRESGETMAALEHIRQALRIAPHDAAIHFESAMVHSRCGDAQGAIAAYQRALELKPDDAAACTNLGLMYLSHLGEAHSAQRYFERAIELDPTSVAAQANLGLALDEQGRVDAALAHYESLIAAHPAENEYRWNRGLARLGSGDYARGWEDYEMRNARATGAAPRAFPYPVWQGGALGADAALLVYGEQGLGDEIMFASCVPDLLARGISCVIECDARLAGLFARSFPAARVHGAARDGDRRWLARYPQIAAQIAIGSLPRLLRRDGAAFPRHAGFLRADAARVAYWRTRLGAAAGAHTVGIAWRGGTAKTRRGLRSIAPAHLMPLFEMAQLNWVNLQRDDGQESAAIPALRAPPAVVANEALQDLDDTAALIGALDCVVTADNTIAHLAGALARRTLIMLPRSADWRWRSEGATSPWYPSVQLYRQRRHGDWAAVVADVTQALNIPYAQP